MINNLKWKDISISPLITKEKSTNNTSKLQQSLWQKLIYPLKALSFLQGNYLLQMLLSILIIIEKASVTGHL